MAYMAIKEVALEDVAKAIAIAIEGNEWADADYLAGYNEDCRNHPWAVWAAFQSLAK
jgi:hypothetical protein